MGFSYVVCVLVAIAAAQMRRPVDARSVVCKYYYVCICLYIYMYTFWVVFADVSGVSARKSN